MDSRRLDDLGASDGLNDAMKKSHRKTMNMCLKQLGLQICFEFGDEAHLSIKLAARGNVTEPFFQMLIKATPIPGSVSTVRTASVIRFLLFTL